MLLAIEFRSHSAIALYIKKNYNFEVIKVPLPFSFCGASQNEKLDEVIKSVAVATKDKDVFKYPAQNKVVIVDESIFGKLKSLLNLEAIYISDSFSELLPLPDIASYLPFKMNLVELSNIRANQNLIGSFFPITPRDVVIQAAIAKTIIRQLGFYKDSFPEEMLLCGPVFNLVPRPSQAVEIFLDGVDGVGATYLYQDKEGVALPMAAASLKVVAGDFVALGSVVIWPGPLTVDLFFDGAITAQKVILDNESIARFPLREGQTVRVIGHGEKGDFEAELLGGEVGLVIDSRHRPLVLPQTEAVRFKVLKEYWGSLNK